MLAARPAKPADKQTRPPTSPAATNETKPHAVQGDGRAKTELVRKRGVQGGTSGEGTRGATLCPMPNDDVPGCTVPRLQSSRTPSPSVRARRHPSRSHGLRSALGRQRQPPAEARRFGAGLTASPRGRGHLTSRRPCFSAISMPAPWHDQKEWSRHHGGREAEAHLSARTDDSSGSARTQAPQVSMPTPAQVLGVNTTTGGAGRLDVLARCLKSSAAVMAEHQARMARFVQSGPGHEPQ